MKKTTFLLTIFLLLHTACNDNLDIEPQQAISSNIALSNEQGVKTALIGAYDLLSDNDLGGGRILLHSELYAETDNQYWTNFSFDIAQIFNKDIAVDNFGIEIYWVEAYETINLTNNVLAAIDLVKEVDRNVVAAEARFIRGLIYFDLINLFAKTWLDGDPNSNLGMPLITLPTSGDLTNLQIPRNTVEEVYLFLIEDLNFAKANLPETNGFFATTYAASALLSRVYLMQGQYELATTEADRVIESGFYSLLPNLSQVFNQSQNTPEDIFTTQVTSQDGFNLMSAYYTGQLEQGWGFIGITDSHLEQYEISDQRATLFYLDAQNNARRTAKWRVSENKDANVTQIRLAEMYLTRAEGRLLTNDIPGATADLNVIRNRAGLPPITESDIDLETILHERYIELVFEGHQFRDLKRHQLSIGDLAFDDPKLIFPIPQRELDVNERLVQNEGY